MRARVPMGRRERAWRGALALFGSAWLLATTAQAQPADTVDDLYGWQGAAGPSTGFFSDVTINGSERIHAGYLFDSMSQQLTATLFSTSQPPGGVLGTHDLGFTVEPSVAVSIASQGGGRHWVAVSQSDGVLATTAHVLDWSAGGGVVQTQILGPLPGASTFVTVRGINRLGTAVGLVDGASGLVAPDGAPSFAITSPVDSEVFSISPDGSVLGGAADFGAGDVATIWDASGAVVYQDTLPGRIRAVAPPYAVGVRNGVASWWRRVKGTWIPFGAKELGGAPLAGELLAVDRDGLGIGGGSRAAGGAIVVLLRTHEVRELDDELSLAAGTLWAVHGIDADEGTGLVAFAVEATDFSGWDVTASFATAPEPLPGPGLWAFVPLAAAGCAVLRMKCVKV